MATNNGTPPGEIVLPSPPVLPARSGGGQHLTQMLFMLPMMLGMGAMSFMYIGRSGGVMTWVFGGLFVTSTVGMLVMTLTAANSQRKAQINNERRDYLRYLARLRTRIHETAAEQQTELATVLPAPADLWALCGTERMWERRRLDPDFGRVRVATGAQRLTTPLRSPETAPLEDLDPVTSASLRHFIRTYASVPDLPVAVSLRSFSRVSVGGTRSDVLALTRAIIAHLAAFHDPTRLRLVGCVSRDRYRDWDWLKWLPHAVDPDQSDDAGPVRLVGSLAELTAMLGPQLSQRPPFARNQPLDPEQPFLVVLLDGGDIAPHTAADPIPGRHGVVIIECGGAPTEDSTTLGLHVDGDRLGMRTADGLRLIGVPDRLGAHAAEVLARQMTSRFAVAARTDEVPITATFALADLLGIGDPRDVDPRQTWRRRPSRERLRVPIGVDLTGRPVELDMKESAEGGMGPHGLVIGATGSGKSELLRTLVTGLAVTHSSETLNLALIDFKGGATFAGMNGLPHTCAVITNLAADLTLVDRMADALRGELVRRQELLRAAGNFASARDYERARDGGAPLAPLPSLLVIIDEFSELLASRPDFIDVFVMIGRLGRSLGIHLMLASQRLDEGRLRGLDSHLSYRIGLRTFSSAESRAVLGVPDAYQLPSVPGSAFLKVDTNALIRFKSAYVSGVLPGSGADDTRAMPQRFRAAPYTLEPVALPSAPTTKPGAGSSPADSAPESAAPGAPSVMDAMLAKLTGQGPPAHQIWLPPLGDPPTLDQLMPGLTDTPERGLTLPDWSGVGGLRVPLAIVDKPFEQRRDLLWADLSGAAGHAVVVGGPRTGKSTALRSLISALALTHTPAEVQFFLLDLGGGSLASLAGLPHVSGCANRLEPERCRRIVAEVTSLLVERERLFAEHGIDSMAAFRRAPVAGADGRVFGDVFLVIDGWMTVRQEYEQLEEAITALAGRSLGYGIHVILSANRWMEVRSSLLDLVGTQLELRLGDPMDSTVDRRAAATVPQNVPGRGLTAEKLHFLTALPRIDALPTAENLADGVADLVARVDAGWRGPRAPQVRLLPRSISVAELPAPSPGDHRIPVGRTEIDLGPAYVDFDADPHFVAFGDIESGKTGLLRLLGSAIVDRYAPEQARIVVVDYRRSLLGAVDPAYLLDYCGSDVAVGAAVAQVEQAMRERLPGPAVTAEQLRTRGWWSGPELFLIVDDYDLVANQSASPLAPLAGFLAQGRDIGLHLVIARRTGGAGRAIFDPVLQRLADLATPGIVLSGSRDEGALVGDVRPSPQPPGRGYLVNRRTATALVQLAWAEQPTAVTG